MAIRKFKCQNIGNGCKNCDHGIVFEIPDTAPARCPECQSATIVPVKPAGMPLWLLVTAALILVAGVGYLGYKKIVVPKPAPNQDASQVAGMTGLLGRPLRVGIVTWPGYAGGIVANNGFKPNQDCIYYKSHNLYVEFLLMEDVDLRAKAFARGGKEGVDIVWSTVDFWANELPGFLKSDVKAKAIMQVDWSRGGDAIVADRSITKIEDLYGKKISLALFTPSHWLLEYSLQNSSLDEAKQTQIVKSLVGKNSSPDARDAFVAGKVDAAVVWEPDVSAALQKREGSHVLVSSREANHLISDIMVAREDFIREHPEVIEAFIQGWILDGTEEANRHPDLVAKLLMENEPLYKDLGLETTKGNLTSVKWADLSDNNEMFNLDGHDTVPLFDRIFRQAGKSWMARGYISAPVAPAVAKDDSFLRKIYQASPVERLETHIPTPSPDVIARDPIQKAQITVNFASGSWALDAAARQTLDERVYLIPKAYSGAYIKVEGNTDNVGNAVYNRGLSLRRAQSVIDYLVTKEGLPKEQFVPPVGNGPDKPAAGNDTPEGRAMNRRTEIGVITR